MSGEDGLLISVSGIRGIVGRGLTAGPALAFAQALATQSNGGPVVLGRDSRPSGQMLRHAVLAGLLDGGCQVYDLGIVPTPTCGLAVRRLEAAAGIQITASHNPAPWNGLKLFGPDGAVLSAAAGEQVQGLFAQQQFRHCSWDRPGRLQECSQALTWHRQRLCDLVAVAAIRQRRFHVLVDANGGAGGPLAQALLDDLGCRVTLLGGQADGHFAHEPEPVAANLERVCPLVPAVAADLGLALDPDADRLALIDETGRYLGEELTLALAVCRRLEEERGPVVINMSTSRIVEDLCQRFAVPCVRSPVGEAHVVQKMRQVGAVLGGEGNGGVIDPRVGWVRDPFLATALILDLLARRGGTLSALAAALPSYTIVKTKCSLPRERLPFLLNRLAAHWPEARVNRLDGLRLDWETSWLHVRPSNTEPVVRLIAEAPTAAEAERLCREAAALLGQEAHNDR